MAETETEYDFGDKYRSAGAVTGRIIDGFYGGVRSLIGKADFSRALEVGCGEGYSTARLRDMLPDEVTLEASDVEPRLVDAATKRNPAVPIRQESIYDLSRTDNAFDLVFCMEVLEHLEDPGAALAELCRVTRGGLILTVPREPLWRALNCARGRYLSALGNTPGHLQHWSRGGFIRFVSTRARVVETRSPIPWTQVLARPLA